MFTNTCHNEKLADLRQGLTLIEMTVVIVVLITLVSASMYAVGGYKDWALGSEASQKVRKVYNAQRTYLAEHPTESVGSLTAAKVIPYLSDNAATLPTVETLTGDFYTIKVSQSPPVVIDAGGGVYDPSGDDDDGLWDVGG